MKFISNKKILGHRISRSCQTEALYQRKQGSKYYISLIFIYFAFYFRKESMT